ncbi:MAG TPA: alkaline phosphatase family protein [Tepidisphaeraceae bacterium]|jgi:hypothetical protein
MDATLEELFEAGLLVRPSDERPNIVHLARALARLAGVDEVPNSPGVQKLMDLIGPAEHLVFVLLDGLGMNLISRLPAGSFLTSHLKLRINSICPSTTACALTAIITADYANRHGVAGWYTYLPDFDVTAVMLPFTERFSGESLTKRGINPADVLPLPPVFPRMARAVRTVSPAFIANTVYNLYARGGAEAAGYQTIPQGIDAVIAHATTTAGPTYTYLYLPEIDTMCHHISVNHHDIVPMVMKIDAELSRLATALEGRARIVVSADHGLIDVAPLDQTLLLADDPMLKLLRVPPTGDARMPIFHVRDGCRLQFVEMFKSRFAERMVLLDIEQCQKLQLFGPGAITSPARERFGDYVAIPTRPTTLAYHSPDKPLGQLFLSVHAGLSPEEMHVPLCVA